MTAQAAFVDVTSTVIPGLDNAKVAWGDFNSDGFVDLHANGKIWRNNVGTSFSLFGNLAGGGVQGLHGIWGDHNNDSWLDFLVYKGNGGPALFTSQAGASFSLVTEPNFPDGFPTPLKSKGGSWADFDSDGYLDAYLGGYEASGSYPDYLAGNNQDGSFNITSPPIGTPLPGRGITSADFDRDGDVDVYVSNYRLTPNYLWVNDGNGNFSDQAAARGATGDAGHTIGSAWGDMNNDGYLDLFVGNFSHNWGGQPGAQFLRNTGPSGGYQFQQMLAWGYHGDNQSEWQESYASPALGDYDNDGDLDLFFTTVYGGDAGRLYRNDGNWNFVDATALAGLAGLPSTYQAGFADYDNDGDLDLVTAGRLFENQGNSNHWLKVKLVGDGESVSRNAVGAQVRINVNGQTLLRQVEFGTGEGNQNDATLHFGLAGHVTPVNLEVFWPNGQTQVVSGVPVNQLQTVSFVPPVMPSGEPLLFYGGRGDGGTGIPSIAEHRLYANGIGDTGQSAVLTESIQGIGEPGAIAADRQHVYIGYMGDGPGGTVSSGDVYRFRHDGSGGEWLTNISGAEIRGMALYANELYVATSSGDLHLFDVGNPSAGTKLVFESLTALGQVAIDPLNGEVLFTRELASEVVRLPMGGGSAAGVIGGSLTTHGVAVDAANDLVYFTTNSNRQVRRARLSDGANEAVIYDGGGSATAYQIVLDPANTSRMYVVEAAPSPARPNTYGTILRLDGVDMASGLLPATVVSAPGGGLLPISVAPVTQVAGWTTDAIGSWASTTNWHSQEFPDGADVAALFGGTITRSRSVIVDEPVTVKEVSFNNSHSYAIIGRGSVTLESDSGNAAVRVFQGDHQFQAVVNLATDTEVNVSGGASLALNNVLNLDGHTLLKSGDGTLQINNQLNAQGGTLSGLSGAISGSAIIVGDLHNIGGTLAPGNSPGVMRVQGNFRQDVDAILSMEIGGSVAIEDYDVLQVEGISDLAGLLEVSLLDEFEPVAGDAFVLLDLDVSRGTFDQIVLPPLGRGLQWDATALYTAGSLGVTAVPEPGAVQLLVWAVVVQVGLIRQRRDALK